MSDIYKFLMDTGVDFERKITWKDSSGNIIPLTGYAITMQVRKNNKLGELIVDLSDKITVVSNVISVNILAIDTLIFNDYFRKDNYYDIILTKDGKTKRLIQGNIMVKIGDEI